MTEQAGGMPELIITILGFRAQNAGEEVALSIQLSSGVHTELRTLVLDVATYAARKPQKGQISEAELEQLENDARIHEAVKCGERLLAYGSNTKLQLARKLVGRGFTREEAEAGVAKLSALGLIDEAADLRREVERCLRKDWGEGRIRQQLFARGFDRAAMAQLADVLAEVDFVPPCKRFIQKRYGGLPDNREEERRMLAGLYRYGYRMEDIRQAMRELHAEAEQEGER